MNSLENIKRQLRSYLPQQDIAPIVETLKQMLDDKGDKFRTLLLIQMQFQDMKRNSQRGIIDYQVIQMEQNRIRDRLLELIGDIAEDDIVLYRFKENQKEPSYNHFTDPRDGHIYRTIELNGLVWMAENLNRKVGQGCSYYDHPTYSDQYGLLYTWDAALEACPKGWELPTSAQWDSLGKSYGGTQAAFHALIKGGPSGFNALLGGKISKGGRSSQLGEYGYYWSLTETDLNKAVDYRFRSNDKAFDDYDDHKSFRFSCRCVRQANHPFS